MKIHTGTMFSLAFAFSLATARAQETPPAAAAVKASVSRRGSGKHQIVNKVSASDRNLRLNFRGVSLDMVLNYLSEAAGFIIILETEPKGKVDVWSNQPLNQEEAIDLSQHHFK